MHEPKVGQDASASAKAPTSTIIVIQLLLVIPVALIIPPLALKDFIGILLTKRRKTRWIFSRCEKRRPSQSPRYSLRQIDTGSWIKKSKYGSRQ
jgi:hypothetical protein